MSELVEIKHKINGFKRTVEDGIIKITNENNEELEYFVDFTDTEDGKKMVEILNKLGPKFRFVNAKSSRKEIDKVQNFYKKRDNKVIECIGKSYASFKARKFHLVGFSKNYGCGLFTNEQYKMLAIDAYKTEKSGMKQTDGINKKDPICELASKFDINIFTGMSKFLYAKNFFSIAVHKPPNEELRYQYITSPKRNKLGQLSDNLNRTLNSIFLKVIHNSNLLNNRSTYLKNVMKLIPSIQEEIKKNKIAFHLDVENCYNKINREKLNIALKYFIDNAVSSEIFCAGKKFSKDKFIEYINIFLNAQYSISQGGFIYKRTSGLSFGYSISVTLNNIFQEYWMYKTLEECNLVYDKNVSINRIVDDYLVLINNEFSNKMKIQKICETFEKLSGSKLNIKGNTNEEDIQFCGLLISKEGLSCYYKKSSIENLGHRYSFQTLDYNTSGIRSLFFKILCCCKGVDAENKISKISDFLVKKRMWDFEDVKKLVKKSYTSLLNFTEKNFGNNEVEYFLNEKEELNKSKFPIIPDNMRTFTIINFFVFCKKQVAYKVFDRLGIECPKYKNINTEFMTEGIQSIKNYFKTNATNIMKRLNPKLKILCKQNLIKHINNKNNDLSNMNDIMVSNIEKRDKIPKEKISINKILRWTDLFKDGKNIPYIPNDKNEYPNNYYKNQYQGTHQIEPFHTGYYPSLKSIPITEI